MTLELRLIHAADLHLGYRYAGLPAGPREVLQNDEPRLLERLVALCLEEQVDGLLLAGDVFEYDRPERDVVARFMDACTRLNEAGIYVFISPGNHDPYWPDSPWLTERWPERTVCFSPSFTSFDWKAKRTMIYGAAFSQKIEKQALLEELLPVPNDRRINVLCLHGEVVSEGQVSAYNPLRRRILDTPYLDYVALGHVHRGRNLETAWPYDNAAYAGAWRGRGFDETGRKGVYLLTIRKDGSTMNLPYEHALRHVDLGPGMTFVPLSDYAFLDVSLTRDGDNFTADHILARLETIAADHRLAVGNVCWRVRLTGDYGEHRPSAPQLAAALARSLLHLELTDLTTVPTETSTIAEHSLKGAFLRESGRAISQDDAYALAVELGLAAFDGPLELSRFFGESSP